MGANRRTVRSDLRSLTFSSFRPVCFARRELIDNLVDNSEHWIRFVEGRGGIPMFIMTSDDIAQHEAKAVEGGAKGIFHKPLDQKRLLSMVSHVLDQQSIAA